MRADRGRLANWQLFLSQYNYDVELIAGSKNYLPDALTREMAMFRREDNDEGRNPSSRKLGKEKAQPEMDEVQNFLLISKKSAITDQSQGKGLGSPSQTADGKGSSRPLMAAALPKIRNTPHGETDVWGYKLHRFSESVFKTNRVLAFYQKALLDNLMFAFQERDKSHMLKSLYALAEEMHQSQAIRKQQSAADPSYSLTMRQKNSPNNNSKIQYADGTENARVPFLALKETEWYKFHDLIGVHQLEDHTIPETLYAVPGPYTGRYVVNVQSNHPQEHKLWLVENGFVHNLWTETNEDLKGLPSIIVNTVKNIRKTDCILRLKFRSTPPEWIPRKNGEVEYISPYHYVRIIQGRYEYPALPGYNGVPNHSIAWMKAMTLKYIRKIVEDDKHITYLTSGDKILVTTYDHPHAASSDLFQKIKRNEIDSSLACAKWIDKVEDDGHYKIYEDTDMEDMRAVGQEPNDSEEDDDM